MRISPARIEREKKKNESRTGGGQEKEKKTRGGTFPKIKAGQTLLGEKKEDSNTKEKHCCADRQTGGGLTFPIKGETFAALKREQRQDGEAHADFSNAKSQRRRRRAREGREAARVAKCRMS